MRRATTVLTSVVSLVLLSASAAVGTLAGDNEKKDTREKLTDCRMTFSLKSWSAFYKSSEGEGTITCDNGQTAKVRIKAKGGGLTFGKSEIIGGTGKFTGARNIDELLGSYVQSEVHAGAGKSADAQALTKGEVSLALAGTGRGVDVGFAFGKFTIQRVK
jgi:hypothetical protein